MTKLGSKDDLTPKQRAELETVLAALGRAEKFHRQHRDRWNRLYGLYRNYHKLRSEFRGATSERDRDIVSREFMRQYGEPFFIPYTFSTIETVVPRVLSNNPRMLVEPTKPKFSERAEPVKAVFERDQQAINYELHLQDVLRSGVIYGLGWQKVYWDKKQRSTKELAPRRLEPGEQVITKTKTVYEGPGVDNPDLFDMFWDPNAKNVQTCQFIIHRTWRSEQYVAEMVKAKRWNDLDLERIKGGRSDAGRDELWAERMEAQGISSGDLGRGGLHEVLEFHNGDRVITVLNRSLVVQSKKNPFYHGDLPFQIFRPTRLGNEFAGIGLIEPLVQLQFELNSLRGNRLDAAILALNRGYFVQEGAIRPEDFVTGPGAVVPVAFDPRDVVMPMPFQEPPGTSYQEEAALKDDITLTSGVSEVVSGTEQPTGSVTATGIQLVQQAAGERIKLVAKNLLSETVRPAAAQMRELYSQYAPKEDTVRVRDLTTPTGYNWIKVKREDFANVEITPEAGSTEPENQAEKRANAVQFTQALAPFMDYVKEEKLVKYVLDEFGVPAPESWLKSKAEVEAERAKREQAEGGGPEGRPDAGTGGSPADQLPDAIGQGLVDQGYPQDRVADLIGQAQQSASDPGEFLQRVSDGLADAGMDPNEADQLLVRLSQSVLPTRNPEEENG